jgi:chemotaxis protein MotB
MKQAPASYTKRKQKAAGGEHVESRDRWLLSYADLVTLLLALFIVLYAAADHERATKIASAIAAQFSEGGATNAPPASGVLPGADSLVAARAAIDRAFAANSNLRNRARVKTTERGVVVSLTEAGFFAPADASIQQDALKVLDPLAQALIETKAQVRVEGHTDSLQISTARYPSNWELSAARAATVLSHLVELGVPASRLSVAGFAGERPVGDNNTAEGRALNRRVDLVVLQNRE